MPPSLPITTNLQGDARERKVGWPYAMTEPIYKNDLAPNTKKTILGDRHVQHARSTEFVLQHINININTHRYTFTQSNTHIHTHTHNSARDATTGLQGSVHRATHTFVLSPASHRTGCTKASTVFELIYALGASVIYTLTQALIHSPAESPSALDLALALDLVAAVVEQSHWPLTDYA
jgi:hypothetical protein